MTTGFHSAPRGGAFIQIDAGEAGLLRSMAALVLQLVEAPEPQDDFAALVGIGTSSVKPEDPVLARLFPDAYSDDAEAAGDFRRYTEDDLRRRKRENAQGVLDQIPPRGGEITLDLADAHAWLKVLNDVRLALATRLGIKDDMPAVELDDELAADEKAGALSVYSWLTGLQDSLLRALTGE
ncbi:DUF2017 domain-containing protein [Nocardiopsis ansamitocini]|uniref:DUF2017 domain-containing protein n=1 Tax=Nocardiopsis ansamitocini TaxID=1670832 RepID=A0A9W6PBG4_9ACTN|nr:DUF2017 domain-containing protein [Nocardiopsis ansamitocini]GLU50451.1 hypothetical protein Nans01_48020 [Nocardiopsis ansamitocini]